VNATGPLFAGPPGEHGLPWVGILPVTIAVVAIAILVWALVRGSLPAGIAAAGFLLPVAAYGFGALFVMERSKEVSFCGSCHVMTPLVASVEGNDGSLASIHYGRGLVPYDTACYTCHSGYGIWGTVDAKMAGMMHMIRTATGWYDLPIKLHGTFDIDSCLGCHAHAASFRAVEAHQDPDLQKQLLSHELSCTGVCHPAAHPESALTGGVASR
jgi:hypothetical protein